jgi:hypothetical protein
MSHFSIVFGIDTWSSMIYAEGLIPAELDSAVPFQVAKDASDSSLAEAINSAVAELESLLQSPLLRRQIYNNYLVMRNSFIDPIQMLS